MIVVNVYVQYSDEERTECWKKCKKRFVMPSKSIKMKGAKKTGTPKVVCSLDTPKLREKRLHDTQCWETMQKPQGRKCTETPQTNAQLRDKHTRKSVALLEDRLMMTLETTTSSSSGVSGRYEPVLITASNTYSPTKAGRPMQALRNQPKVIVRGRSKNGIDFALKALHHGLLDVLKADLLASGEKLSYDQGGNGEWQYSFY